MALRRCVLLAALLLACLAGQAAAGEAASAAARCSRRCLQPSQCCIPSSSRTANLLPAPLPSLQVQVQPRQHFCRHRRGVGHGRGHSD